MGKKRFVCVGKVVKAHGIKGEIKIFPYSGTPESLCSYDKLYFAKEGQPPDETFAGNTDAGQEKIDGWHGVDRCRVQGKYAIVALIGFADRSSVANLLGMQVHVGQGNLVPLQENEFYWHELEGMTVVSEDGKVLGTVTSLFSTDAYDMLVINGEGGEVMIPAVRAFMRAIDHETNRLTVALVPGLLEIND